MMLIWTLRLDDSSPHRHSTPRPHSQMVTPHCRKARTAWSTLNLLAQCGVGLLAAEMRVEGCALAMVLCVQSANKGALTAAQLEETCNTLRTHLSRLLLSW